VEGGEQAAEEAAEVHRRPHWRPVHRVLPAPGHPFQGWYHRSETQHQPLCNLCYGFYKLRGQSAYPKISRNSQISSDCHAGLRKDASTALRLTDHLALSKSTATGDM
jgi:hypothetical protein